MKLKALDRSSFGAHWQTGLRRAWPRLRGLPQGAVLMLVLCTLGLCLGGDLNALQTQGGQAGGNYNGPGDTVPAGGATGGGTTTAPPANPGAYTPGGPASSGPAPSSPTGGGSGGVPALPPIPPGLPDSPLAPVEPTSPGSRPRQFSETSWQLWWHYNRWEYLDPRRGQEVLSRTSSDGFYIGRGALPTPSAPLGPSLYQRRHDVLPALIKALGKGGRADSQIALAHALAKLRLEPSAKQDTLPKFQDALGPSLKSGSATLTEKAILFLGVHGERGTYIPLASILQAVPEARVFTGKAKTPWRWRTFAAYGLGHLGERNIDDPVLVTRVFKTLMRAYATEEHPEVRIAIVLSAARMGLPSKSSAGPSKAPPIERIAQVRQLLGLYLSEEDVTVRAHLAGALGTIGSGCHARLRGQLIDVLLQPLGKRSKGSAQLRFGCVTGLAQIVHAGDGEYDQRARKELLRIGFKSSTPRATRFLARAALAQALGRPGVGKDVWAGVDVVRRAYTRSLGRERGESLGWLALSLGILERSAIERGTAPDPQAIRVLREALARERSPDAAPAIGLALGLAGDQESVPILVERLADAKNEYLRGYFSLALGLAQAHEHGGLLVETLLEAQNQPFALENVALALALLGDSSGGQQLMELLETVGNPEVQASLASAIGWSRDPALLHALLERLKEGRMSDPQRAWTAVAIGRMVDQDRWPWMGRWSVGTNYIAELTTRIEPDYRTGLLDLW